MKKTRFLGAPEVHFKLSQDKNDKKFEKKNTGLSSTTRSTQYLLHTLY